MDRTVFPSLRDRPKTHQSRRSVSTHRSTTFSGYNTLNKKRGPGYDFKEKVEKDRDEERKTNLKKNMVHTQKLMKYLDTGNHKMSRTDQIRFVAVTMPTIDERFRYARTSKKRKAPLDHRR